VKVSAVSGSIEQVIKEIKNTIIIHQPPQIHQGSKTLVASQEIPVHTHPSAGNYPVLNIAMNLYRLTCWQVFDGW